MKKALALSLTLIMVLGLMSAAMAAEATIEIPVTKIWAAAEGTQLPKLPESVTMQLYIGEQLTGYEVKLTKNDETSTGSNTWTGKFTGVRQYDDNGNEIQYTVKEKDVHDGYEVSYKDPEPEKVEVVFEEKNDKIQKTTESGTDGIQLKDNALLLIDPTGNTSIIVWLEVDPGEDKKAEIEQYIKTNNKKFQGLGGGEVKEIDFRYGDQTIGDEKKSITITENNGKFNLKFLSSGTSGIWMGELKITPATNWVITNTYKGATPSEPPVAEEGSLTITKKFEGNGTSYPEKIKFTVESVEGEYAKDITLTANTTATSSDWTTTLESLLPGTYTVTEDTASAKINGYELNEKIDGAASKQVTVEAGKTASIIFTNTYKPVVELYPVNIKKVVKAPNGMNVPENFTIKLTPENGTAVTVNVGAKGEATANVPAGTYTVEEVGGGVSGYDLKTEYSQKTFTVSAPVIEMEIVSPSPELYAVNNNGVEVPNVATVTVTVTNTYTKNSPTPTPTPTPTHSHRHDHVPPVVYMPPKTGDMTIWQSILHFLGIR